MKRVPAALRAITRADTPEKIAAEIAAAEAEAREAARRSDTPSRAGPRITRRSRGGGRGSPVALGRSAPSPS